MDFFSSKTAIDKNQSKPQAASRSASYSLSQNGAANTSLSSAAIGSTRTANAEQKGHKLELDHERAMSMTGVRDVPVFTDKNLTVRLDNETLLVTGQNLAVKTLDIESGRLTVTGRVFSLRYTSQAAPKSLMKRIFK